MFLKETLYQTCGETTTDDIINASVFAVENTTMLDAVLAEALTFVPANIVSLCGDGVNVGTIVEVTVGVGVRDGVSVGRMLSVGVCVGEAKGGEPLSTSITYNAPLGKVTVITQPVKSMNKETKNKRIANYYFLSRTMLQSSHFMGISPTLSSRDIVPENSKCGIDGNFRLIMQYP